MLLLPRLLWGLPDPKDPKSLTYILWGLLLTPKTLSPPIPISYALQALESVQAHWVLWVDLMADPSSTFYGVFP